MNLRQSLALNLPALNLLLWMILLAACGSPSVDPEIPEAVDGARAVEAISLLGEELERPELPDDFAATQQALLAEARAALEAAPDDPKALIWVGRRTAYLGRYREAIEIYSRGLELHPEYPALYRHRGHRYLSTRQLERAIEDLDRAAELIAGQPDEIEPDGLPNERGIPTSTLQSNIFYHLGLAHYLRADFESALAAFERCLTVSSTPDNVVATSHWLYLTLRRLGRDDEARRLLEAISADMDIIENHDYHRLLLMAKDELEPDDLWQEIAATDSLASATLGYGLANRYLYGGDRDRGLEVLARILVGGQWAAFGYLAAEAEMARVPDYEREILTWRAERYQRLLADDGWLSVVALFPLEDGELTFGTDPAADLVFPGDGPPAIFGHLSTAGEGADRQVVVHAATGTEILHQGHAIDEIELVSDAQEGTIYLEVAPYRFFLIERSRRPFLRLIDLSRLERVDKPRIDHFPIDESWRIEARFEPYDPARTITVPTVLETVNQSISPGALVFERDGAVHRLDAIDSGDDLFIIFADETTGAETYGGGRYIYTELADADGRITLDLNRAYNPPCVFTAHATCPLPPRQNRMALRVEAGERMVEGYLDH